jgi:CDP-glucose 4,6-dehydratase
MEYPLGQRLRELPGPLLLTGHTGFKGTWMTFLLEHLNVPVVGYSLPPERGSLFERAERTSVIPEKFADIRECETFEKFVDEIKPSTIIHMAAQPLVLKSYENPLETFEVNVMGTANVLEAASKKNFVKAIIVVTTDKVYRNDNSGRAFVESDLLEGKDPYSASKVGTEAVVSAWQQIARVKSSQKIASVRAGNVVGGGDFAADRIVSDIVRGIMHDKEVIVRNPKSVRPWQHVIDPLMGYLMNLERLICGHDPVNMNFGPDGKDLSVENIVEVATTIFPKLSSLIRVESLPNLNYEAEVLKLNSETARRLLNWEPKWSQEESILLTFNWWYGLLHDKTDPSELCQLDIKSYFSK